MKLGDYWKTLLAAAALIYFAFQSYGSVIISIAVPVLLIGFIIGLTLLIRRPQERRHRTIRMVIWILALILVMGVESYRARAVRGAADAAAQTITAYHTRTGSYPASFADVGLDAAALDERWTLRYWLREGRPRLVYDDTLMPLDEDEYDFDHGRWSHNSY
jgi:hypothetical protein